jgi:sec-independent protein translocase protein TatB
MFDITSSKLLLLGIVALLVIGPKDLPALLRTIGKYMGIIKRHAADFRAQFEEAIRDSEIEQLKKDVEKIGAETQASFAEAEKVVNTEIAQAQLDVDRAVEGAEIPAADPLAHHADGLPIVSTGGADSVTAPLNGAGHPPEPAVAVSEEGPAPAETQKSGA